MESKFESLKLTPEEIEAIEAYQGNGHLHINSLLERGLRNERAINEKLDYIAHDANTLGRELGVIKRLYSAMVKYSLEAGPNGTASTFRGTTEEEMLRLRKGDTIGRCLSTTTDKGMAEGYFVNAWQNKAVVYVRPQGYIPFLDMKSVLEGYGNNWEKEVLFSPFTEVSKVEKISVYEGKNYYGLQIQKAELPEMTEEELSQLEKEVMDGCQQASTVLKRYLSIPREIESLQIRIESYQKELKRTEKAEDRRDIEQSISRMRQELSGKESEASTCEKGYSEWKDKVVAYNMGSCNQIEKKINRDLQAERDTEQKRKHQEQIQELEDNKNKLGWSSQRNFKHCDIIGEGIQGLANTQNQYVRCAQALGINYIPGFDSRDAQGMLGSVRIGVGHIQAAASGMQPSQGSFDENVQGNSNLSRLMSISSKLNECLGGITQKDFSDAEKSELLKVKGGISQKIEEIKAAAEKKKLESQRKDLMGKNSGIRKLFNRATGLDKVVSAQIEQISIKRQAIENKLHQGKNQDRKDYSIHEMLSRIDIYVEQNQQNGLVTGELEELRTFRGQIKNYFDVNERKVKEMTQQGLQSDKTQKPKQSSTLNRVFGNRQQQIAEIKSETQQWKSENGYEHEEVQGNQLFSKEHKVSSALRKAQRIAAEQGKENQRELNRQQTEQLIL